MCLKSNCSDTNCIFQYKSYSKTNPLIKPGMCKLNINIATQILERCDYTTCEIGMKQTPHPGRILKKILIIINQMIREEKESGRL